MTNPFDLLSKLSLLPQALFAISALSSVAANVGATHNITESEAEIADKALYPLLKRVETIQSGEVSEGLLALDALEDAINRVIKAGSALAKPAAV